MLNPYEFPTRLMVKRLNHEIDSIFPTFSSWLDHHDFIMNSNFCRVKSCWIPMDYPYIDREIIWTHLDSPYCLPLGYGSIPILTFFGGMNLHKSQLFWCELQGYLGFWPIPTFLLSSMDALGFQLCIAIRPKGETPSMACHHGFHGIVHNTGKPW